MEYKELRAIFNRALSALIIGGIFLVIGLCFIPLTITTLVDGTKLFLPASIESIFMYVILGVSLIFFIVGTIFLVKYKKAKKTK